MGIQSNAVIGNASPDVPRATIVPVSRARFLQRGSLVTVASVGIAAARAKASLGAISQAAVASTPDADFWKGDVPAAVEIRRRLG